MSFHKIKGMNRGYRKAEYARLILLDYINRYPTAGDVYQPSYFNDELKLSDIKAVINTMLKQKYLERDRDGIIILTEKGNTYLAEGKDLVSFFRFATPYATIDEYRKVKHDMRAEPSFEMVMLELFLQKIPVYVNQDDFVSVKCLHHDIATLYEEVGMDAEALYHYMTALYYDTSGLEYYDAFLEYIEEKISLNRLRTMYDYTYINPKNVEGIRRLKDFYKDEMIYSIYDENIICINFCKRARFKQLMNSIMEGTYVNHNWQRFFWIAFNDMVTIADKFKK